MLEAIFSELGTIFSELGTIFRKSAIISGEPTTNLGWFRDVLVK